jgi:hypothetical protein
MKPNSRLVAAFAALDMPVGKLAAKSGVDRSHLHDVARGRCGMGREVADGLARFLGLNPSWIRDGGEPMFLPGRSPGPLVERAIARQMELGSPMTGGVPVFDAVEDVVLGGASHGPWRERALRGVAAVAAASRKGFFLHVGRKRDADAIGCSAGDFVLFVPTRLYLRRSRLAPGDEFVGLIRLGSNCELCRLGVAGIATALEMRKAKRTGREGREEHDIKEVGADGAEFRFRKSPPRRGSVSGGRVVAIAIRAERDLVRRAMEE